MTKDRFYSFNAYLRNLFGERVQRLSLNAGFACPNLDGNLSDKGCIYCNNKGFSVYVQDNIGLSEQIQKSIELYTQRRRAKKFIAYFQSFSNTYADINSLKNAYDVIKSFPQIVGLFISTRPDCIDEDTIKLIASYQKDYLVWIEYGLQTTHNHLLKFLNRNHTYEDFLAALAMARKYQISVGVHLILGIPHATYDDIMIDARRLALLDIQGIKFHVLHVLKNTLLEQMYRSGIVKLFDEQEYIKIMCDFLEHTPSSRIILRLVSDAPKDYLLAPLWINRKSEVIAKINIELERRGTFQGYFCGASHVRTWNS